ncbi:MAG: alpha/beta hydrolase [Acidobacteria bacterium]|nr:alpha/beta hydrolase [Acidobacteriota bacterium]MBI3426765.1 alpha/beta hydrolase [Acidobacteriota bacterium]
MKRQLPFVTCLVLCLLAVPGWGQTVVQLSLKSEVLGEVRTLLVRTPRGYEQNELRYPVLYMTDGAAQFEHTNSTIEFLARNGRMPEMIVVAINNTDRTRDLTPTKGALRDAANGEPLNFPTAGGAEKFLTFIEKELIPQIEGAYRTHPYRIFAGHSFGGLLALHTFLNHTELFNAYLAVSPTTPSSCK